MNFPLRLTFKLLAVAPQITVTEASGSLLLLVRQKAFKLKESVKVFADEQQSRLLATIEADRVIDWSASYHIRSADGRDLGVVRREGMRSLWRAHYELVAGDGRVMTLREENPWTKLADGIFGQIPIIGLFAGYVFHPAYLVEDRGSGTRLFRLVKRPALFEGIYDMERAGAADNATEMTALLGMVMMLLLERTRG